MDAPTSTSPAPNTVASLLIGFAAGAPLALAHFGGLWLTLAAWRRRRPWPGWLLVSFLLRAALVLVGFFFAARHGPTALASALAAFALVRILFLRRVTREPATGGGSWT